MAAKKSIITNTTMGQTGNNDIDETGVSEANEDLQKRQNANSRERDLALLKLQTTPSTNKLSKGKNITVASSRDVVSLRQLASRGKLGILS